MFKIITIRSVATVAVAAFLAGTIVLLISVAPPANATPAILLLKNSFPNVVHSVPTTNGSHLLRAQLATLRAELPAAVRW